MATGRTVNNFSRIYVGGYDLSGYARSIGPLDCSFQEGQDNPLNASLVGTWLGQATISAGTMNSIFDNTATSGIHALLNAPPASRVLSVPIGIRAVPAQGDPVFCGQFRQADYVTAPQDNPIGLTINFGKTAGGTAHYNYAQPWGTLLHANSAVTAVNSAVGVDQSYQTTKGGYMVYHVLSAAGAGDITATIKVQDADTNLDGSFGDLLSSGVINCGSAGVAVPTSGVVALAATATVEQFVRWQIVLGTATSVTFVLTFVKNYI